MHVANFAANCVRKGGLKAEPRGIANPLRNGTGCYSLGQAFATPRDVCFFVLKEEEADLTWKSHTVLNRRHPSLTVPVATGDHMHADLARQVTKLEAAQELRQSSTGDATGSACG